MTTTPASASAVVVPLRDVEEELNRQMKELQGSAENPIQRACMSNLVVYCDDEAQAEEVARQVPEIVASHPARVLLAIGEPVGEPTVESGVIASVLVRRLSSGRREQGYCEQVTLRGAVAKLPFAVRGLLIGDLPINVWWRSLTPPPLAGPLLYELAEKAQQIIYDSLGWTEPTRAVAATSSWLEQFEHGLRAGHWRVASDVNWRRLKFWRRMLRQALDPAATPGATTSASELLVEHGPHAVVQAWELVSWLTSQLGWQVQNGNVEKGVEIGWQFQAPHGLVRIRIQRRAEGPPEVLMLRLKCQIGGQPGAVVVRLQDSRCLVAEQEGVDAAPRTAMVQPQLVPELIARQLSDRDRDPVFAQSMAVAQRLAKSILD